MYPATCGLMTRVRTTENDMNDTNANATTDPEIQKVLQRVYRFHDRDRAFGFAGHAAKTQWVMLGDDGRYWVATPADCARLERAGYEYAD
jgi:hypothetical protein